MYKKTVKTKTRKRKYKKCEDKNAKIIKLKSQNKKLRTKMKGRQK